MHVRGVYLQRLTSVPVTVGPFFEAQAALNENLAAVNKAHSFEAMAISLSAAIQLLCARLGQHPLSASESHIAAGQVVSKAA